MACGSCKLVSEHSCWVSNRHLSARIPSLWVVVGACLLLGLVVQRAVRIVERPPRGATGTASGCKTRGHCVQSLVKGRMGDNLLIYLCVSGFVECRGDNSRFLALADKNISRCGECKMKQAEIKLEIKRLRYWLTLCGVDWMLQDVLSMNVENKAWTMSHLGWTPSETLLFHR